MIVKCEHCNSEETYLFAVIDGKTQVYDCKACHKRTSVFNGEED